MKSSEDQSNLCILTGWKFSPPTSLTYINMWILKRFFPQVIISNPCDGLKGLALEICPGKWLTQV